MEKRKNNPAKPLGICSRLFNFLVQNFPSHSFKLFSQGNQDDASPSTVEKSEESLVHVVVYAQNGLPQLEPPTVVPVVHHLKGNENTSAKREDSRKSKDQEVGAPLAKPRKNSATIKDASKKQPSMGVKGSVGEGAATEDSGKEIPGEGAALDINKRSDQFIRDMKDTFARGQAK